jgi:hypothetical protein
MFQARSNPVLKVNGRKGGGLFAMSFKVFDATPRVFDAFLFLFNTLLLNSS